MSDESLRLPPRKKRPKRTRERESPGTSGWKWAPAGLWILSALVAIGLFAAGHTFVILPALVVSASAVATKKSVADPLLTYRSAICLLIGFVFMVGLALVASRRLEFLIDVGLSLLGLAFLVNSPGIGACVFLTSFSIGSVGFPLSRRNELTASERSALTTQSAILAMLTIALWVGWAAAQFGNRDSE